MESNFYEVNQMRKNYPVKVVPHHDFYRVKSGVVRKHWHRSIEIILAQYNPIYLWINGIESKLKKNEIVIINSGEIHGLTTPIKEDMQGCSLLISYTFLRELNPKIDLLWFEIGENKNAHDKLEKLVLKIQECYDEKGDWYNLMIRSTMYEIIYILFTECAQGKNEDNVKILKNAEMYKEIITYLNENYQNNIRMSEVAEHFGYNADYFSRAFKNYIGENFKDYLRRLRLYKARKQLIKTDLSITDISVENGFTDCKAFIRDFKNDFEMTPLKYRKNFQEELYLKSQLEEQEKSKK